MAAILKTVYFSVTACLLLAMLVRIWRLYRLKRSSPAVMKNGVAIITTTHEQAPFSFLNNLFWKEGMDSGSDAGRGIMRHELAHIRQGHTLDKLFLNTAIAFFWINLFYWIIGRELSMVHEFLADERAVDGNDADHSRECCCIRAAASREWP